MSDSSDDVPSAEPTSTVEREQTDRLQHAIGCGVPRSLVLDMQRYVKDAQPYSLYKIHPETPLIYEILDKSGWEKKVREFGEVWLSDESNIVRAARQVKRNIPSKDEVFERLVKEATTAGESIARIESRFAGLNDKSYLLRAFCIFSLREKKQIADWVAYDGFLGCDRTEPQTVVFCALEDLDAKNGFIMVLKEGFDVCLDGRADVHVPRYGGGRGIFLALNL